MPESPNFKKIVVAGSLDLALPTIDSSARCHPDCHRRWAGLSLETQGLLGGHIHYDAEAGSWSVPFDMPLRLIGVLSQGGVIRRTT